MANRTYCDERIEEQQRFLNALIHGSTKQDGLKEEKADLIYWQRRLSAKRDDTPSRSRDRQV